MPEQIGGQERADDTLSRRRRLIDSECRPAFDAYHGKQGSNRRNMDGAGKGDGNRTTNKTAYDLGIEMMRKDLTDEERSQLEREWYAARRVPHPDDR